MTREELENKLNDKQIAFCRYYITKWSATQAAKDAGYSERTAGSQGHDLLKKPEIKEYINLLKNEFEEFSGVSKLRLIQELANIAFSSIAHLHNTWIDRKEFEELTEPQKSAIESIETKTVKRKEGIYGDEAEVEEIKIKLHSKIQAIDRIGKLLGYDADSGLTVNLVATKIKWGDDEIQI